MCPANYREQKGVFLFLMTSFLQQHEGIYRSATYKMQTPNGYWYCCKTSLHCCYYKGCLQFIVAMVVATWIVERALASRSYFRNLKSAREKKTYCCMPHNRASCHAELAEVSQHTVQLPVGSVRQYWNKSCLPQIEVIPNSHCKLRTFSESTRGKNCSPQSSSSNDRSPFHIQWLCFKIYF